MATKSFLTPEQWLEAERFLRPPSHGPDGDKRRRSEFMSAVFSEWLGKRLLERLSAHPDWSASGPIALGSWARGELCPKSDIDILFCGEESAIQRLVGEFAGQGLKLRYRTPRDPADWTVGVEPFDILNLFSGRALTDPAAQRLAVQLARIEGQGNGFRRKLLRAMLDERKRRSERYDSIANFLEPNLKYGPGGLRDVEQALLNYRLFPGRFSSVDHALEVLLYYKSFFLLVRQKLHLAEGTSEILSAAEQQPLAEWLGYPGVKDFMRQIQRGLSRVSFYADWSFEVSTQPLARLKEVERRPLAKPRDLFRALETDSSLLMQNRVRGLLNGIFDRDGRQNGRQNGRQKKKVSDLEMGRELSRLIDPVRPEAPLIALFRSRLIDHVVSDFRSIVGYVQHDQYHRFAVDAHLLQALRELKRLYRRPRLAGRLASAVKSLSKKEWQVLAFAALYHDIAKGRGGDHSRKGVEIARRDLERFGHDRSFIEEVLWLVEEHLSLSVAAFRENSKSPRTWGALAEKGVSGRRIPLLAVFTVVDIKATNPDAWTAWKERLLFELVQQLEKPETNSLVGFARALRLQCAHGFESLSEEIDPFLIGSIPAQKLAQDIASLSRTQESGADATMEAEEHGSSKESGSIRVIRLRRGSQTWIRFHDRVDRPGLFLEYVVRLAQAGLSIRHASIWTDPRLGVYDWFEVKTIKSPAQIRSLLTKSPLLRNTAKHKTSAAGTRGQTHGSSPRKKGPQVRFDSIELVSQGKREWVVSFRGRDQSGALRAAVEALYRAHAQVRWAKVHTWGRQIEDVFGIAPLAISGDSLIRQLSIGWLEGP